MKNANKPVKRVRRATPKSTPKRSMRPFATADFIGPLQRGQARSIFTKRALGRGNNLQGPQGGQNYLAAPLALTKYLKSDGASISGKGDTVRVRHREYLFDLAGSILFTSSNYAVNPGLSQLFPWLSQLARNYQKYRFRFLRFHYTTTTSANTQGSVMLALDLNTLDAAPINKAEMMNQQGASRCAVWESVCCDLPESVPELFIRSGPVPGADLKTYDAAGLDVCTSNMSGSSPVGEVYVEYDVILHTPQLASVASTLMVVNTAIGASGALFGTPALPTYSVGLSQAAFVLSSSGTGQRFGLGVSPGGCILVTVDVIGAGITGITISAPSAGSNLGTALGPISQTITATRISAFIAFTCNSVANTLPSTDPSKNLFLIDVFLNGGVTGINAGNATMSVSPWQIGLPFV